MGLFNRSRREHAVTRLLRHMEHGRFVQALRQVGRAAENGPPPPPHALWRLGRWCLRKERPKAAVELLELFLALYPAHCDRPEVMRDLARALAHAGKRRQAEEMAAQAEQGRRPRPEQLAPAS